MPLNMFIFKQVAAAASLGGLFTWGRNDGGQLGLNDITNRSVITAFSALPDITTYSSGGFPGSDDFAMAIDPEGKLYTWGRNTSGQLGIGSTQPRSVPVQVGNENWIDIAAGDGHALAVRSDGTLWAWGANSFGQLGRGNTTATSSPVQIGSLNTWTKVTASRRFSGALKSDGTLWTWGWNDVGQLGLGTTVNVSSPVQVTGGASSYVDILAAGFNFAHFHAIASDGTLWGWGRGRLGENGLGLPLFDDNSNRSTPQMMSSDSWKAIYGGLDGFGGFAIRSDDTLWVWGYDQSGASGTNRGTATGYSSPIQVGSQVGHPNGVQSWAWIGTGNAMGGTTFGIEKNTNKLYAWGTATEGISLYGDGVTVRRSAPALVSEATNWSNVWHNTYYTFGRRA